MDCNNTPNQNKVPFDPGWNDPPTLSYNTQQTQTNRPRNFLNKRVAFPQSNASSPSNIPPGNLPSLPTVKSPPTIPTHVEASDPKNTSNESDINFDSDGLLKEVKQVLLEFLERSSELRSKSNDIKRRIAVMDEMWIDGKLHKNIQLEMKELAYALRDDDPRKADNIHRALMVDYVSAVGSWMPGVKQLVHHCIARSDLMAIEKEE